MVDSNTMQLILSKVYPNMVNSSNIIRLILFSVDSMFRSIKTFATQTSEIPETLMLLIFFWTVDLHIDSWNKSTISINIS